MSHAVLSPSAASRWLVCTPSARLELQFSDDAGDYAKEGSLAHEFGEAFIKGRTGAVRESELEQWLDKLRSQEFYEPDMERYAEDYADLVYEKYLSARHATCDAIIRIEEKIDLTGYAPEAFGTVMPSLLRMVLLRLLTLNTVRECVSLLSIISR